MNACPSCNCEMEDKDGRLTCPKCDLPGSVGSAGTVPPRMMQGLNFTIVGPPVDTVGASSGSVLMGVGSWQRHNTATNSIPLDEGDQIGDYKIRQKVGNGAFGAVYSAFNQTTQREVALKAVLATTSDGVNDSLVQLREEHTNREKIHDISHLVVTHSLTRQRVGEVDIITMEMPLAVMNFRQWLEARPQGEDEEPWLIQTLSLFLDVSQGVAAIHRAGLTHLDLKPENVLLFPEKNENGSRQGSESSWVAKVTDLGLARVQGDTDGRQGVGTPFYMSPEQFFGRPKDMRFPADVYALGVLLFEILDGEPPFRASSFEKLGEAHREAKVPHGNWWARWGETMGAYRGILTKSLEKAPEKRHVNATEFFVALKKAFEGGDLVNDVICHNCGHFNRNPALQFCENCDDNISEFFRSCPRCSADVRRDQSDCPECGYNVGAYFLQQDRWRNAGTLESSQPTEAKRLLMALLRENPGKFEKDAEFKLKELRGKLKQGAGLIQEGREASARGDLYVARSAWESLLGLFNRHEEGIRRQRELDKAIGEVEYLQERLIEKRKGGFFEEAKELARKGMQEFAGTRIFQKAYEELIKVEQETESAVALGKDYLEKAELLSFQKILKQLEELIPESDLVRDWKRLLVKLKKEVEEFTEELERSVRVADFDQAQLILTKLSATQSDLPSLPDISRDLNKRQKDYRKLVASARDQVARCQWKALESKVEDLKEICPQSAFAESLQVDIRSTDQKVIGLVSMLETYLKSAQFDEARNMFDQFKATQSDNPQESDIESKIVKLEERFNEQVSIASKAEAENCWGAFKKVARELKSEFPDAERANQFCETFDRMTVDIRNLRRRIEDSHQMAEFDEARVCLEKLERLDGEAKDIEEICKKIKILEDGFSKAMEEGSNLQKDGKLIRALKAADEARDLCGKSTTASDMIQELNEIIELKKRALNNAAMSAAQGEFKEARKEFADSNGLDDDERGKVMDQILTELREYREQRLKALIGTFGKWSYPVIAIVMLLVGLLINRH